MKQVIIIGAGYGGVRAMEHLSAEDDIQVTLIDQNAFHYLQTEAYALIANSIKLTEVTIDLESLCSGHSNVKFVKAKVEKVCLNSNKVFLLNNDIINFDYLVIATGSRTSFPKVVKGLSEHAHGVKTLDCAFNLRQRFAQQLYELMKREKNENSKTFNVVIGGAGLSGVEIAAQLAEYSNDFMSKNHIIGAGLKIYLVASKKMVLDGMHPYLQKTAQKRLNALGVELILQKRIKEVDEGRVFLNDGQSIPFNFMIFTGGVDISSLTKSLNCELTPKGKIIVNDYLQLEGYSNTFAIGDTAEVKDKKGNVIPETANGAEQAGNIVAKQIKALIKKKTLKKEYVFLEGVLVALGGKYASIVLYNKIKATGYLGHLLKSFITWQYKVRLDKKASTWYKKINYKGKKA